MTVKSLAKLTPRWTQLRYHPEQSRFFRSDARFRVLAAGRRSGKTEITKRDIVKAAVTHHRHHNYLDGRYFFSAPTHDQARDIYWDDALDLTPPQFIRDVSLTHRTIYLVNGSMIRIAGLDKPSRLEGKPIDGIAIDEVDEMRSADVWKRHIRPALDTPGRPGKAIFLGVPRYGILKALRDKCKANDEWDFFTWKSADILEPKAIAEAKRDLDPVTFAQEYEASFTTIEGRAYYPFSREIHCRSMDYDPNRPLILCFDFNVDPGVCAIVQEQALEDVIEGTPKTIEATCVIGEVHIPRNSNTPAVCRRIIQDWGRHPKRVTCYGDPTGGNRGTAKIQGSDWDLIRDELRPVFGERLLFRVDKRSKPGAERSRVNATNTRLMNTEAEVHLFVDDVKAPHVIEDFEGVTLLKGGSGEINKKANPKLSHISDALAYYLLKEHPVGGKPKATSKVMF